MDVLLNVIQILLDVVIIACLLRMRKEDSEN